MARITAALGDHRVEIAIEHRDDRRFGHVHPGHVTALVGFEPLAVACGHQAHAELVELVALPRAFRGKDGGARDVVELGSVADGHRPRAFSWASSRG